MKVNKLKINFNGFNILTYLDEDRKRNGYIEEDTISESVSESELTISKDKVEETIKETENQEKEEKDVVN